MRKKHDEGYVLIFVLVVIAVLSIVAISLMSGALRNLQAQKASVERMQAKYDAQGEVEKQIADMSVIIGQTKQGVTYSSESIALAALIQEINSLKAVAADSCSMEVAVEVESEGTVVRIECEVILHGIVQVQAGGGYMIQAPESISYASYKISYSDAASPATTGGAAE